MRPREPERPLPQSTPQAGSIRRWPGSFVIDCRRESFSTGCAKGRDGGGGGNALHTYVNAPRLLRAVVGGSDGSDNPSNTIAPPRRDPLAPHVAAGAVRHRRPRPGGSRLGRDAAAAEQTWWQMLPLGPTGYGDSPYQCFSAFAGNPNLVSPELLVRDGLLSAHRPRWHPLSRRPRRLRPRDRLQDAPARRPGTTSRRAAATAPCTRSIDVLPRHADWLDDFALFMAFKGAARRRAGRTGPRRCAGAKPDALEQASAIWRTIRLHSFGSSCSSASGRSCTTTPRKRHSPDRRHADLRGGRLRRRVGESATVPARRGAPADGAWRRAAGLLLRHRPALGQPALRLGGASKRPATPGGARLGRRCDRWTWCASTTSAASRRAGTSRPASRRREMGGGCQAGRGVVLCGN